MKFIVVILIFAFSIQLDAQNNQESEKCELTVKFIDDSIIFSSKEYKKMELKIVNNTNHKVRFPERLLTIPCGKYKEDVFFMVEKWDKLNEVFVSYETYERHADCWGIKRSFVKLLPNESISIPVGIEVHTIYKDKGKYRIKAIVNFKKGEIVSKWKEFFVK